MVLKQRPGSPTVDKDGTRYRSQFELAVAGAISDAGVLPHYEQKLLHYTLNYTPDFAPQRVSDGRMMYLEAKGYFPPEDRAKILAVLRTNPAIRDIFVLVFQRPDSRASKTLTYGEWATKHNIQWTTLTGIKELLR